nr:AAA family ATPase [uncultured Bdellovibrio sp.]
MKIKNIHLYGLPQFSNTTLELSSTYSEQNQNHFTVLIGNNGTGKSTILADISKKLTTGLIKNLRTLTMIGEPTRVLAISTGINDKFFLPKENSKKRLQKLETKIAQLNESRAPYIYIGPRTGHKTSNNRKIHERLLENIALNWIDEKSTEHIAQALELCNFKNEIYFKFKIKKPDSKKVKSAALKETPINRQELIEIVTPALKGHPALLDYILEKINSLDEIVSSITINQQIRFGDNLSTNGNRFFKNDLPLLIALRDLNIIEFSQIQVVKQGQNETLFDLLEAGSGEFKRFLLLFSIAALTKNDTLILIDEPEISLHPKWQADFLIEARALIKERTGCHLIVATHSPYLISSLNSNDSTIVSLKTGFSESHRGATFGWPIEKILFDIFDVATVRNSELQKQVEIILRFLSKESSLQKPPKKDVEASVTKLSRFITDEADPLRNLISVAKRELDAKN